MGAHGVGPCTSFLSGKRSTAELCTRAHYYSKKFSNYEPTQLDSILQLVPGHLSIHFFLPISDTGASTLASV